MKKLTKEIARNLTDEEAAVALYEWRLWADKAQLPPRGEWPVWMFMGGRGAGKTRAGAQWVLSRVNAGSKRIALVGPTSADVRDVMVEGESGILACAPPWDTPIYEPSKRKLRWRNGCVAHTYSADEPDRLRGPQHTDAWCDEIAIWRRVRQAWDNLMLGLRLGADPRACVTTTAKPRRFLKELMALSVITRRTTYDNLANLSPGFRQQILSRYKDTRLERQELLGHFLEEIPGALWTRDIIRCQKPQTEMRRVVVAIDPAVTSGDDSDDTGIIVAGVAGDGNYYVLADETCHLSPKSWASRAVKAYHRWQADRIVGEVNNGGDLVEAVLREVEPNVPYRSVHAARGKRTRAEPVAALYEKGKVFHAETFAELEDQLVAFTPDIDESPDRADALVWAISDLAKGERIGDGLVGLEPPQVIRPG